MLFQTTSFVPEESIVCLRGHVYTCVYVSRKAVLLNVVFVCVKEKGRERREREPLMSVTGNFISFLFFFPFPCYFSPKKTFGLSSKESAGYSLARG